MNQKDDLDRLSVAIDHAVPDVLESILAQCSKDISTPEVHTLIDIADIKDTKKPKKKTWQRRFAAIAAAMVLVLFGMLSYGGIVQAQAAVSTVSLDAGTNIQVELNRSGKVVSVSGVGVTDELKDELKGKSLEQATSEIVSIMVSTGEISAESNSLLISVSGENADQLEVRISAAANETLVKQGITGAIISQILDELGSELSDLAGIPAGRAEFIEKLSEKIQDSNKEELSKLSVNELNILMSSSVGKLEGVLSVGTASSSAYVSTDSALACAYAHAGISEGSASAGAVINTAAGRLSYEFEFSADGISYEYNIDAKTGEVIGWVSEVVGGVIDDVIEHVDEIAGLSLDEAKELAIAKAGIDPSLVGDFDISVSEDGQCIVTFKVGDISYSYDMDPRTGDVIKALGGISDFFKSWG